MTHARLMFPHPVLRPGGTDYIDRCKFDAEVTTDEIDQKLWIDAKYRLSSKFLNGLISSGIARYMVTVKCSKTGQRKALKSDSSTTWELDGSDFRETLLVSTYVIAEQDIEPFESDEHNHEIRGMTRAVPAGSILAMGKQYDSTLDSVEGSVKAAIRFIESDRINDGLYAIDLDKPFIEIAMSRKTYSDTAELKRRFHRITLPMPILTATEQAIRNIEEHKDRPWARAIKAALERKKINTDDPNYAAQLLLDRPYRYAFSIMEANSSHE